MDIFDVLLFFGFILSGAIIASPITYALGQRSILQMLDRDEETDVLDAAVVEEKQ